MADRPAARLPPTPGRILRGEPLRTPFQVVLIEPEIPQNTGNIARLCAATSSSLHLCGKLGFRIDEHAVRRAGLDYWPLVDLHVHESFAAFERDLSPRVWLLSAHATRSYTDVAFAPGDALVFGKESVGLPRELLDRAEPRVLGIPTLGPVRSLNLANAVAIALFEALRQQGVLGHVHVSEAHADP